MLSSEELSIIYLILRQKKKKQSDYRVPLEKTYQQHTQKKKKTDKNNNNNNKKKKSDSLKFDYTCSCFDDRFMESFMLLLSSLYSIFPFFF